MNPYTIEPVDTSGFMTGLGGLTKRMRTDRKENALRDQMQQAMTSGNPQDLIQFMSRNPEHAEKMKGVFNFKNDMSKQAIAQGVFPLLQWMDTQKDDDGNFRPEAIQGIQQRIVEMGQQVAAAGGDPQNLARTAENFAVDPKGGAAALRGIAAMSDMDTFKYMYPNTIDPQNKVGARKIFKNGTIIQSTPMGAKVWVNGVQIPLEEHAEAIAAANKYGEELDVSKAKRIAMEQNKARVAADKESSENVTRQKNYATASDEAYNISRQISLFDEGLHELEEGAKVGWFNNMFPSMNAATLAFENVSNRLGLQIIAGATFGALSAGEMKMAMDTAMPKDMKGDGLKNWIKNKQDNMRKLQGELLSLASHLKAGGDKDEWVRLRQQSKGQSKTLSTPSGIEYTVK